MFDFDETQRAIAEALRDYCRREIEPLVPRLEAGEASPYDVMRDFARAFGLDEMIGGPLRSKAAPGCVEVRTGAVTRRAARLSVTPRSSRSLPWSWRA